MLLQTLFLIYSLVIIMYVVYIYVLYLGTKNKEYNLYDVKFSVVIPCYNESKEGLVKCLESVLNSKGNKEVILVNNNSTKLETLEVLNQYKDRIRIIKEKNQGLSYAQMCGVRNSKNKIIVFIDSDTIVKEDSFIEMIKPFQDENIGCVCGHIKLLNNKQNFFTKCLETMYWCSFEFYRKATSGAGYLFNCSGAFSAYYKKDLEKIESDYLTSFCNEKKDFYNDAYMSFKIQSNFGKKAKYCSKALAYTETPSTFKGFWKQLKRWRKGFILLSLYQWTQPKNRVRKLFVETQYNLITQLFMNVIFVYIIIVLIRNFSLINLAWFFGVLLINLIILSIPLFVYKPSKIGYNLCYNVFYQFIFSFTFVFALFSIGRKSSWGTR